VLGPTALKLPPMKSVFPERTTDATVPSVAQSPGITLWAEIGAAHIESAHNAATAQVLVAVMST
jgi:hypothetical protein